MKFDWTVYPNSRISRIRFRPLQLILLLMRNMWVFARRHRPRNDRDRLINLSYIDSVKISLTYIMCAEVDGSVSEFGCHGNLAKIIARWLAKYSPSRCYHIFDSFEGYPAIESDVDLSSPHILSGTWYSGASSSQISAAKLAAKLSRIHEHTYVHVGFFNKTLPAATINEGFSLLILDCNLYSSHNDVLSHVFSRGLVNEGAMVMFADYNVNRASPEFSSRRAWREAVENFEVRFSDEGPYNWGGHRFIVHGYRGMRARLDA